MKLRIIGGQLRGRVIRLSGKLEAFRPTMDRTREAVASTLQRRISGAIVADVCAGSGAFGFEMLSRGATRVDFVEQDRFRAAAIRTIAQEFGVMHQCRVLCQKVESFLKDTGQCYDIIYFDPPYDARELYTLVADLRRLLTTQGILVVERPRDDSLTVPLTPDDRRTYGSSAIEYYHREGSVSCP